MGTRNALWYEYFYSNNKECTVCMTTIGNFALVFEWSTMILVYIFGSFSMKKEMNKFVPRLGTLHLWVNHKMVWILIFFLIWPIQARIAMQKLKSLLWRDWSLCTFTSSYPWQSISTFFFPLLFVVASCLSLFHFSSNIIEILQWFTII